MIDWKKLGFEEYQNWGGQKVWRIDGLWLMFQEEKGFLTISTSVSVGFDNHEQDISSGEIPATEKSVKNILKAFYI